MAKNKNVSKMAKIALAAGVVFGGVKVAQNPDIVGDITFNMGLGGEIQLVAPTDFSYDQQNCVLSWSEVEGATKYKLNINRTDYETNTNKLDIVIDAYRNFINIQAIGDGRRYTDSEVVEDFVFMLEKGEISPSAFLGIVNGVLNVGPSLRVINSYPFYNRDGEYESYNVELMLELNERTRVVKMMFSSLSGEKINSIYEVVDDYNKDNLKIGYLYVDSYYDREFFPLKDYAKESYFTGEIQNLIQEGYDLNVLSMVAYGKMGSFTGTKGTVQLTKNNDIKYYSYDYNIKYLSDVIGERDLYSFSDAKNIVFDESAVELRQTEHSYEYNEEDYKLLNTFFAEQIASSQKDNGREM